MNIIENVTITLSENDLQELIKENLEKQGFRIDGKISINMKTQTVGYGPAERDETVFTSITCRAKKINGL